MRQIKVGHVYKHFKNKYYVVVDIVNDCESNNDTEYRQVVIYKALYGEHLTWARPYEMFASEVDHEKYPDVQQKYRFEEVDIDTKGLDVHLQTHQMIINALLAALADSIDTK